MCSCFKMILFCIYLLIFFNAPQISAKPLQESSQDIVTINPTPNTQQQQQPTRQKRFFGDILDILIDISEGEGLFDDSDEDDSDKHNSDKDKYLICRNCTVVVNGENSSNADPKRQSTQNEMPSNVMPPAEAPAVVATTAVPPTTQAPTTTTTAVAAISDSAAGDTQSSTATGGQSDQAQNEQGNSASPAGETQSSTATGGQSDQAPNDQESAAGPETDQTEQLPASDGTPSAD